MPNTLQAPPNPRLAPVEAFIPSLTKSREFHGANNSDSAFPRRLARTALTFGNRVLEANKSTVENLHGYQLQLLGRLPDFIYGGQTLERYEELRSKGIQTPEAAVKNAKRKVIPYNHTIRALMDTYPHLASADIIQFATRAATALNPDDSVKAQKLATIAGAETEATIIGMKHEMGAGECFWQIPEVEDVLDSPIPYEGESDAEYEERQIEDELNGIDLRVLYKGHWVTFDIKASEFLADKSKKQAEDYDNDTVVMWSHLLPGDFIRQGFRIGPQRAAELAPIYQTELEAAIADRA